jgi:D-glycero-D-manno-heptose 1,7-bisphosphate phosphatase
VINTPLLILDIDGTVRQGASDELGRFVNSVADVRVFPAAVARMRAWRRQGGRIIGVSNQGGIGLNLVSARDVAAAMLETERQCLDDDSKPLFEQTAWCEHIPDNDFCWCRKPRPGMVYRLLDHLERVHPDEVYPRGMALLVGDRPEDVDLAASLDVTFQYAEDWRSSYETATS